jgi:hypothetical protein
MRICVTTSPGSPRFAGSVSTGGGCMRICVTTSSSWKGCRSKLASEHAVFVREPSVSAWTAESINGPGLFASVGQTVSN